jgi:uncharacterized protein with HEPN domain
VSLDPRLYLEDMRDCCQKVIRYSAGMTMDDLVADEKTFDAVMRNLEITGEAAGQIGADIKERHPEVSRRAIAGFRDIPIHAYPTIDEEIVWDRLGYSPDKVPELLEQIESILAADFP